MQPEQLCGNCNAAPEAPECRHLQAENSTAEEALLSGRKAIKPSEDYFANSQGANEAFAAEWCACRCRNAGRRG